MAGKKTGRNMPRDSEMEQEDEVQEFLKEKGSRTLEEVQKELRGILRQEL